MISPGPTLFQELYELIIFADQIWVMHVKRVDPNPPPFHTGQENLTFFLCGDGLAGQVVFFHPWVDPTVLHLLCSNDFNHVALLI